MLRNDDTGEEVHLRSLSADSDSREAVKTFLAALAAASGAGPSSESEPVQLCFGGSAHRGFLRTRTGEML